jgi:regulator of PEP synthase PpsR (kinase-PPPase family)
METLHLHLISDATGETIGNLTRACLAQFPDVDPNEHPWNLVRTEKDINKVIKGIEKNPGMVLYTLVNRKFQNRLEKSCLSLGVPCVSALDPIFAAMSKFFGLKSQEKPGHQHVMDAEYFHRLEAMNYVLTHDDGQSVADLDKADVILVGVSRTSKTPTCLYLANRGISAANIPLVPDYPLPPELLKVKKPLIIGLTKNPKNLVQVRKNRLNVLNQDHETDYADIETVQEEVRDARRIFTRNHWPVIDGTRKSIEEIAAIVLQFYARHKEGVS